LELASIKKVRQDLGFYGVERSGQFREIARGREQRVMQRLVILDFLLLARLFLLSLRLSLLLQIVKKPHFDPCLCARIRCRRAGPSLRRPQRLPRVGQSGSGLRVFCPFRANLESGITRGVPISDGDECSVAAQQIVDAGLGPRLGIDLFDDDRAIQAAFAVAAGSEPETTTDPAGTRP